MRCLDEDFLASQLILCFHVLRGGVFSDVYHIAMNANVQTLVDLGVLR